MSGTMQRKAPQAVGECFDLVEREITKGPWVMGADYTMCDAYLFTVARWIEINEVDPARLPKIIDHRRRMADRPSVQRVLAAEKA